MKQTILLLSFLTLTNTAIKAQSTDFFDESNTSIDTVIQPMVATPKSVTTTVNTVEQQPKAVNTEFTSPTGMGVITLMQFDKKTVDFGKVKFGETRSQIFSFKNISNEPITIDLISACDCTEVEYTRETVPIGGAGFVKATFHSDRTPDAINGSIHKDITIILKNQAKDTGYPIIEELFINADIVE